MKKKLIAGILAAALLIVGASAATAAKPSGPTGSIELAADSGEALAVARASYGVAYNDTVSFDTTVDGAGPKAQVYITVICMQGRDVVYQVSGAVDADFTLDDRAGLVWDGGAADCEAHLVHRVKQGRGYEITYLDMDAFSVS